MKKLIELLPDSTFISERNDALLMDKEVRKFIALRGKRSKKENIEILTNLINKNGEIISNTRDIFYKIVDKGLPKKGSSQEYKFMHQIKSISSIINKVIKRGKSLSQIGDIIRGVVLFKDYDEMNDFIKDFRRKQSKYIIDYEYKKRGNERIMDIMGLTILS